LKFAYKHTGLTQMLCTVIVRLTDCNFLSPVAKWLPKRYARVHVFIRHWWKWWPV